MQSGFLLLFAAGALAGLAQPPIGQWWVFFISFAVLARHLARSEARSWRQHFVAGLAFGFGYFVVAFHWIGFAFLVDAKTYLWMMPFAVGGLALFMACYWAIALALATFVPRKILPPVLHIPVAIGVAEYLRGHFFTGFPWAVPGLAADGMGGVLQLASVVGMTGLTVLLLLWSVLPFALWAGRRSGWRALALPLALLALLPLSYFWGEQRLASHATAMRASVNVRLVQPNISQDDKWRQENAAQVFASLLELSQRPPTNGGKISHVIWPESAVSFLLDEEPLALQRIGEILEPDRILLAGAIRRTRGAEANDDSYFTSILMIDASGAVRGTYDKWRLVPGGEFLPFEPVLAALGFRKVVTLPESFTAGPGPRALSVPGAGFAGALICYEVIFPHRLVPDERPQWLVNVTNDGWFGKSVGPHQHLAQARLRAVEQGLPLARAANTGISAVIDPFGRIVAQSPMAQAVVVDSELPEATARTLYAASGDIIVMFIISLLWLTLGVCPRFEQSSSPSPL